MTLSYNCFHLGETNVIVTLRLEGYATLSFGFFKESNGTAKIVFREIRFFIWRSGILCTPVSVGTDAATTDVVQAGETMGGWQYGVPAHRLPTLQSAVTFYAQSNAGEVTLAAAPIITCTASVPLFG